MAGVVMAGVAMAGVGVPGAAFPTWSAATPTTTSAGSAGIGRGAAQRLARTELSKPLYHHQPPLAERILHGITRWLTVIFHAVSQMPGGWWSAVALAALAVLAVAGVAAWREPAGRTHTPADVPVPGKAARDHRRSALQSAQAGDYTAASCECVRAVAAALQEHGVLPPRSGRTTGEFAVEAGHALPEHAGALHEAVLAFDAMCYGNQAGTRAGYERLREFDTRISADAASRRPTAPPPPPGTHPPDMRPPGTHPPGTPGGRMT